MKVWWRGLEWRGLHCLHRHWVFRSGSCSLSETNKLKCTPDSCVDAGSVGSTLTSSTPLKTSYLLCRPCRHAPWPPCMSGAGPCASRAAYTQVCGPSACAQGNSAEHAGEEGSEEA